MNITCDHCKQTFTASGEQASFILDSQKKGMRFIMLECPSCYSGFSLNPQTMDPPLPQKIVDEDHLRCPVSSCYGLISYVEDEKPFWGCGECGTVWFTQPDLFEAIEKSIEKYPYRAKVYTKKGNTFFPAPLENEPDNYEETVAKE
ncbi:hypothetical protein [Chryseobacterium sp. OV279]|uniref:hypothetical protein n=1 Tax=Chryseobacterium sp. OV279 TaxID=1500285 RepID=UPI00090F77DD|nr:hypothetical protein [Chryseobacterium sp. OV279]SHE69069.1 hypothetical protein SAMN02787100_0623 [Chryseobacterium sp. OV279]